MVANRSKVDWQQGQDALRGEVARVTTLLRPIQDPGHAVGQWNLGEVAMHLSQAWVVLPDLARQDLSRVREAVPSLAGAAQDSLIRDLWELADTTTLGVKSDPERDRLDAGGGSSRPMRPWRWDGSSSQSSKRSILGRW